MRGHLNRRKFIGTMGLAAASGVVPTLGASAHKNSKLRILQVGVGGMMGGVDRQGLIGHPKVEFAGLCDINKNNLDAVSRQIPKAKTYSDCRDAYEKDLDDYDAVLICTPDHAHALFALHALANDKHLFLQKPVVHQLEEVGMLKKALAAKPGLVTQMGNQRSAHTGRNQAIAILKSGTLGKVKSAWAWINHTMERSRFDQAWIEKYPVTNPIPKHMSWDLWKNGCKENVPYSDDLTHIKWRSYWEFGSGDLGDWCCHLLDIIYLALDLDVPIAVQTDTPMASNAVGHSTYNHSRITFNPTAYTTAGNFIVHYSDAAHPPCAQTGLPPGTRFGNCYTLFACENGTLVVSADGDISIFQNGKKVDLPRPEVAGHSHWHDWVDNCLGAKKELLGRLDLGVRVTEAGQLAVKATRYPNRELVWNSKECRFKDDPPNKTILRRSYRDGFKPPAEFI
ncbi:MAG: Gfo/Idh/MocA family oxidoreductase [Akkermansiaceae bacterium]|nr:Gfo/Idh/MocA family oxidoreductase [Akkermansiaceae bacterium]